MQDERIIARFVATQDGWLDWTGVHSLLPGRTMSQIKTKYYRMLRSGQLKEQPKPQQHKKLPEDEQ